MDLRAHFQGALSADPGVRNAHEQTLRATLAHPGAVASVLDALADTSVDGDVRLMAALCAKHAVQQRWTPRRGRDEGAPPLDAAEKNRIRASLIPLASADTDTRVAAQAVEALCRVARVDGCRDAFPDLLPGLLNGAMTGIQGLRALHKVVKELASRRLLPHKREFISVAPGLNEHLGSLWALHAGSAFASGDQGRAQEAWVSLEAARCCAKTLRQVLVHGYAALKSGSAGAEEVPSPAAIVRGRVDNMCSAFAFLAPLVGGGGSTEAVTARALARALLKLVDGVLDRHGPRAISRQAGEQALLFAHGVVGQGGLSPAASDEAERLWSRSAVFAARVVGYHAARGEGQPPNADEVWLVDLQAAFAQQGAVSVLVRGLTDRGLVQRPEDWECWAEDPEEFVTAAMASALAAVDVAQAASPEDSLDASTVQALVDMRRAQGAASFALLALGVAPGPICAEARAAAVAIASEAPAGAAHIGLGRDRAIVALVLVHGAPRATGDPDDADAVRHLALQTAWADATAVLDDPGDETAGRRSSIARLRLGWLLTIIGGAGWLTRSRTQAPSAPMQVACAALPELVDAKDLVTVIAAIGALRAVLSAVRDWDKSGVDGQLPASLAQRSLASLLRQATGSQSSLSVNARWRVLAMLPEALEVATPGTLEASPGRGAVPVDIPGLQSCVGIATSALPAIWTASRGEQLLLEATVDLAVAVVSRVPTLLSASSPDNPTLASLLHACVESTATLVEESTRPEAGVGLVEHGVALWHALLCAQGSSLRGAGAGAGPQLPAPLASLAPRALDVAESAAGATDHCRMAMQVIEWHLVLGVRDMLCPRLGALISRYIDGDPNGGVGARKGALAALDVVETCIRLDAVAASEALLPALLSAACMLTTFSSRNELLLAACAHALARLYLHHEAAFMSILSRTATAREEELGSVKAAYLDAWLSVLDSTLLVDQRLVAAAALLRFLVDGHAADGREGRILSFVVDVVQESDNAARSKLVRPSRSTAGNSRELFMARLGTLAPEVFPLGNTRALLQQALEMLRASHGERFFNSIAPEVMKEIQRVLQPPVAPAQPTG